MGLAGEAMATLNVDAAVAHLSAAVRSLTDAGDNRPASMACAQLGELYESWMGNKVAARPWFERGIRLVADEAPCVEQGWVAVAPLGCDVDDPALLWERASLALERARSFGDVDLEVKALADGGLARVQSGDLEAGMAMIDEAMALACGGQTTNADAVGKSVCSFYTACYHTADFERVASWSRAFAVHGILGPAPGPQAFLSSHCGSVQAALLCHLGRWGEAEQVLLLAHNAIEQAMPGAAWHTPIALAELRILQGRLEEAEVLLLGRDDHIQALLPMARLHLARGDHDLAAAAARRGLRMMAGDRVRSATLLGVLVESALADGDLVGATAASVDLDERVGGLGLPAFRAEAARLRARVLVASDDTEDAVEALRVGIDDVSSLDLPLLRSSLHLDLARLLEPADRSGAVLEAKAAAALLQRMDVLLHPDDHTLLARLGATPSAPGERVPCRVAWLTRDLAWWTAGCGESTVRLRDTKGLRHLAALVARPGVEHHALDLVAAVEGLSTEGVDRRRLGDAGPGADTQARDAYRRRITDLRDEVEDALAVEDDERAAKAQSELDELVAELARTFGLGGRARQQSSAAEKARLNVTRALRSALVTLAEALPEAGAVLDRRVRTGTYCVYEPHVDDGITWSVHAPANAGAAR